MKFLIDNALSPDVDEGLRALGHDAVHVRDVGMQRRDDDAIFDFAARERRVLVSADTDFGQILALRGATAPSVVLPCDETERTPSLQPQLVHRWTSIHERALLEGAVLTIERARCRVRKLPITKSTRRN